MLISDIIGPVMVGPSSSHTAGAVRIGNVARRLLSQPPVSAEIFLHGSFRATGRGHGTDRAIVAGLLGMKVDDPSIPDSFRIAQEQGLQFKIYGIDMGDSFHPNTAKLILKSSDGETLEIVASSVGGGSIRVVQIDGLDVSFSGELPTLIVQNLDQPGHVAEVTSTLQHKGINIANMQLVRKNRGGKAAMVLECDQEIPRDAISWLSHLEGVTKVICLSMEDENVHFS